MTASQAFSQKLYEAAARDANAAGTSASGQTVSGSRSDDDEIVDAEIVDDETSTTSERAPMDGDMSTRSSRRPTRPADYTGRGSHADADRRRSSADRRPMPARRISTTSRRAEIDD